MVVTTTVVVAGVANATQQPHSAVDGIHEYYKQQAGWQPCAPTQSRGGNPLAGLDCASVSVPLDYRNPTTERLSIAISRKKATDPTKRRGALLIVPGGPGGEGLDGPLSSGDARLAASYDLIGFDPRGTGQSTPLLCEDTGGHSYFNRPTDAQMQILIDEARERDQGCQRTSAAIRPYFTTANEARDIDIIRAALGEKTLNLMGRSYGTYVTAVYGSLFPRHLDRSVLDSAVNPGWVWREAWKQQAVSQTRSVDVWMAWVAQRNRTYGLGSSLAQVRATIDTVGSQLAVTPIELPSDGSSDWSGMTFDRDTFDRNLGVMSERQLWDVFARVVMQLRDLVTTPSSPLPADTATALSLLSTHATATETSMIGGVWATVNCEANWPSDLHTYEADMRLFATTYPYGPGAMAAAPHECTFHSFTPVEPLVKLGHHGYPTGIVVQGEFDPATPYEGGPAMAGKLGDRLITVRDEGHHVSYGSNSCVDAAVDDYLIDGTLPQPGANCAGTPRPDVPADSVPAVGSGSQTAHGSLEAQVRKLLSPAGRHS